MAQTVYLQGATYSDVPSIVVPTDNNGGTASFMDTTDATATAEKILSGYTAYVNGALLTGTASGGSSWTPIASTSYSVSTTSTSASSVATWSTGDSSIWTADKIVYIKIRDSAGKRSGYFYGSDNFMFNYVIANGTSATSSTNGFIRISWACTSSNQYSWRYGYGATGYGVYADYVYSNGRVRIRSRYNSSYTLTIDGTYTVEVYLLDPPSAIFT